jgi:hypothetical protein
MPRSAPNLALVDPEPIHHGKGRELIRLLGTGAMADTCKEELVLAIALYRQSMRQPHRTALGGPALQKLEIEVDVLRARATLIWRSFAANPFNRARMQQFILTVLEAADAPPYA